MRTKKLLIGTVFASLCLLSSISAGFSAEKQKYYFMVFSNPVSGKEGEFLKWYEGQHMHDLLRIPGFTAAQFFKLADSQFAGTQPQRYLMIWEFDTDNLAGVFADVNARLKDGRTVQSPAFDNPTFNSTTMYPITKRLTSEDIRGKTADEIEAMATGK